MGEEAWRALVDVEALAAWMDAQGLGSGPVEDEKVLAGGTQNLLLSFSRNGSRYVLRRPSGHARPEANETIKREIQVLSAIAHTDVPHPRLLASCGSPDVLGANFYLMQAIDGFNVTTGMPAMHASDPAIRREMGFALVDGALRLGRVNHVAVGLASFGRAEGYLERQVGRWRKQFEGYAALDGWSGAALAAPIERVGDWLERNCPASFKPGILHGDYHLANVMFANTGPELAAIVDWELATIGDPLIDLGWVLTTWPRPNDPTSMKIEPWEGFPSADELLAYYRERSERDLSAMDWYIVLACYKLAILLEGTHARACAGKAAKETGDRFHARTVALFERALGLI
ncbi:phosphotransferase family protein [Terricaulis sp.]|uniref:phosphotransferase family protein n=1 Tax=Terricaulis sp. TaxID=2768686 RepID=UPI003782EF6F